MKQQIERARRALWTFRQPLTRIPRQKSATVSDLFMWRNSATWRTYFELIDVCGLFVDQSESRERAATLLVFDHTGVLIHEGRMDLLPNRRRTIDLSTFTASSDSEYGTFCIFHSRTPEAVSSWGSFIAERGYVSYRYRDAPLRSYVHGNLDAVALTADKGSISSARAACGPANIACSMSSTGLRRTSSHWSIRASATSVSTVTFCRIKVQRPQRACGRSCRLSAATFFSSTSTALKRAESSSKAIW